MNSIDTARYIVAIALIATLPPMLLFWILIHPLASVWRRIHPAFVYGITLSVVILGMAGIVSQRKSLLAADWGTQPALMILGIGFLGIAFWLRILIGRSFTTRQLVGLPELDTEDKSSGAGLVTTGVYAHLRHPRYVQIIIASLGYGLFANYPAAYLAVILFIVGIYFVVLLEERELRARFGSAYDEYAHRVPRFIPRRVGDSKG
jgi:protein-S-isoprenylcysteine O-methyltransferase Ste14